MILYRLGALILIATTCACGSTEGRIVTIEVAVESLGEPDFVTSTGWSVHLERASIAIGPVRALAPRATSAHAGGMESRLATIRRLLFPTARAHGAHDPWSGRRVRAEWIPQVVVDALTQTERDLGQVEAESGVVGSMHLALEPPTPDNTAAVFGHHAYVRGEATREGETIEFEGGLHIPDAGTSRRVENIPFDAILDDGGRWVIGVRPSIWFEDAHFDRLDEQDEEGVFEITPNSQVRSAWLLGARSSRAYGARYEPSPLP